MSEYTRRAFLEAGALAAALGALPAAVRAEGTLADVAAAPPDELAAAWKRFTEVLAAASQLVVQLAPTNPLDQAEGYRVITRLLGLALDRAVEGADPDHPHFHEVQSPTRKYAGDNPDQRYHAAQILGDRSYRIRGNRGNAVLLELGVYAGSFTGANTKRRLVAHRTEADLVFDEEGGFELTLSGAEGEHGPNHLALEPDAESVLVRSYFADPLDKQIELVIERDPKAEPAAPLTRELLASRLGEAAAFVDGNLRIWTGYVAQQAKQPPNRLAPLPLAKDLQTPAGVRYQQGYWKLAEDEVLVVDVPATPVAYWGFLVMNVWMESLEYRERPVSLNNHQAQRGASDAVRIVVAQRDPGLPNWIDTAGHREGPMSLRWARLEGELPVLKTRVVKQADLAKERR